MRTSKKQPWGIETFRPPKDWSMQEAFDDAPKRNTDLRPYTNLILEQLKDAHKRESETDNPEPDVDHDHDHHYYFERFQENLAYVRDWNQYEVLELLIQKVDLGKTTIPWLRQFREDLDLRV